MGDDFRRLIVLDFTKPSCQNPSPWASLVVLSLRETPKPTVEVGDAVDADRSESATGTDRARKAEKARVHDAVLIRRAAVPKKKPPLLFGQRRLRICEFGRCDASGDAASVSWITMVNERLTVRERAPY
jgi:hypothetical protein